MREKWYRGYYVPLILGDSHWARSPVLGASRMPASVVASIPTNMSGYQNYGPLLGPLNTMCRIIIWSQKGTINLTTTHILVTFS